jgi:hypothetical protein
MSRDTCERCRRIRQWCWGPTHGPSVAPKAHSWAIGGVGHAGDVITHVVLFRFHDPADAGPARDRLGALRGRVPTVRSLSVGVDAERSGSPWHVALTSTYDDWDALAAYASAPAHVEVMDWLADRVADKAVVDYES